MVVTVVPGGQNAVGTGLETLSSTYVHNSLARIAVCLCQVPKGPGKKNTMP